MALETRIKVGWQTMVEPIPFNGVPYDLVKAIRLFHKGWGKYAFTPGMFPVKVLNDNPDQNADITAEIEDDAERIAIITASGRPTGIVLCVESSEQDWVILEKSWIAFREFLEQEGWIGTQHELPTTQLQVTNPPSTETAAQAQRVKSNILGSNSKHYDVFISYSSLDEKIAEKIASLLSEAGLQYWLDKKDILIGEQILDRVRDGITKESDYTLIVLSNNSVASEWCKEEIRIAYQKEFDLKRVVLLPITIDQAEIPAEVRMKKYYKLDTGNDESFQSLVMEIKSLIDKQALS